MFDPEEELNVETDNAESDDAESDDAEFQNVNSTEEVKEDLTIDFTCPICINELTEETGCVLPFQCGHPVCDDCYAQVKR